MTPDLCLGGGARPEPSKPNELIAIIRPLVRLRRGLLLLGLATTLASPAAAAGQASACTEGVISSIFVDSHSVFDLTDPDLNPRFNWAYRLVNGLHVPTREVVIRREILFTEGDCYDVERLRDSERLVRAMPFIADVDIFGVRQADGTFHVIVDTRDEWTTRVEPRIDSGQGLRGLRLREDNLLGTGRHVSAFYLNREEEQVYGFSYRNPQLLASRWDAELEAGRTPVGYLFTQSASYPFVGQVGRWAFRQALHHNDRYFELWMPYEDQLVPLWVPETRRSFEVGGAYRWGTRGFNRTLLGFALSGEWISYPEEPRFSTRLRPEEVPPELPVLRMDSVSSVRALFLTGQRNIYFVRRRALDTVNGTEDVRLGVETEMALGPTLPGLSRDRNLAGDLSLFAGGELAGLLGGMQLLVEGRRNYDSPAGRPEWSEVLGQLNAWAYWRPDPDSRHTLVGSVRGVGGWHTATPFQLTLGGIAGMRGYSRHVDPGARRIIASLEHRSYLGWPLPDLFDLGGVAFLDVGRIWAGDAPFGSSSGVRANVGIGLRAAFPPGSRQTLRVDVGVPLDTGLDARSVVVSVGMGQLIGRRQVRADPQLRRSMRLGASTATFVSQDEP